MGDVNCAGIIATCEEWREGMAKETMYIDVEWWRRKLYIYIVVRGSEFLNIIGA